MDKCNCDKSEEPQKEDNTHDCSMSLKNKKHKISLTSLGFNFRKVRSKRSAKKSNQTFLANPLAKTNKESSRKSSKNIFSKFNCTKKETKVAFSQDDLVTNCCTCPCSQKTEESEAGPSCASEYNIDRNTCTSVAAVHKCTELDKIQPVEQTDNYNSSENGIVLQQAENSNEQETARAIYGIHGSSTTIIVNGSCTGSSCDMPCDIRWIRTVHQDCDETARLNRAREIEQGVEAPANFKPVRRIQLFCSNIDGDEGSQRVVVYPSDVNVDTLKSLFHDTVTLQVSGVDSVAGCHTQVDFIHCLVPDMFQITQCSFYWGKMDRYEAEKLLDGKPEGTFLLRDSAQEEFLFSVSFRKYNRSLHARVEQWNHKFSFDAHDPGVFTSDTICGLMEHYKDPSSCMFFEPMLSYPLNRSFPFSLQHLCRAVIVNRLSYDNITNLSLPKSLKSYLKEYHYKQKVRVERFDEDIQVLDIRDTNNGHKDSFSSISKIV